MSANPDQAQPPVLERLTEIWKSVLEVEAVGPDDNFFMLGGDSLRAAALMVHIEETFHVLIDPVEIFEHPELKVFAALIGDQIAATRIKAMEEGVL